MFILSLVCCPIVGPEMKAWGWHHQSQADPRQACAPVSRFMTELISFRPMPGSSYNSSHAAFGHQVLNVTLAERETMVRPDRAGNDRARKMVAFQARLENLADHRTPLPAVGIWVDKLTLPPRSGPPSLLQTYLRTECPNSHQAVNTGLAHRLR